MASLAGQKSIPIDSSLVFRHPEMDDDLRVRSGANAIKWSYELNTVSTPTVGGEVVQVLSCFVGPITIEGLASGHQTGSKVDRSRRPGWGDFTPTDEVQEIIDWFLRYMHLAGSLVGQGDERRSESAIRFSYPARGWEFWIQVIDLQGFDFSADQVAVPWSITAEVVSDAGLDYFEAATMNTFTDDLTSRTMLAQAISPGKDFLSNPFVNPTLNAPTDKDLAERLGDNFQSLVASWGDSNFMTWGFNPIGDPGDVMKEDPYSTWAKLTGGEYLGQFPDTAIKDYQGAPFVATDGGDGGSAPAGGAVDPTAAQWIQDVLKGVGGQQTQENVCFMKTWAHFEDGGGGAASRYNWLNTTQSMPGADTINADGVKAYKDAATGVRATVQTILNGHYPHIVAGLRSGNILQSDWAGVSADLDVWGTGHAGAIRSMATTCAKTALATPTATAAQRAMIDYIGRAENNEPNWHYVRGGPAGRTFFPNPGAASISTDCSGYTACVYHAAGISIPAQSDAQGARGHVVSGSFQVGDLCIYPDHVTVVKAPGAATSAIVSSHGQESGPRAYRGVNYRGDLQKVVRIL